MTRAAGGYGWLNGKTVLLTGGTGSFGQQFVAQVLGLAKPRAIRVYSRDEWKQHQMAQRFADAPLRFLIGDVRDKERLARAMHGVDIVVHAAALKQVPACEYNPFEAVKTNVLGAENIINTAIDNGVQRVLAISTDKAVNPVNVYGATKLCAEKLFVQGNSYASQTGTRLSCARYGNVVASRGSVIPLFAEQRVNGTVTVTDERMTRFWITLEQGVDFVLRCLETMQGGEIFVPKIPTMNITDLVEAVAPGCRIKVTGIRPGEKLHELLISSDEARHAVELDGMYVVLPTHPWWKAGPWEGEGRPLADGFVYSSQTNPDRLSVPALREMIARLELLPPQEEPEASPQEAST